MQEEDDDFLYRPHRAKGQRLDPAIQRMALAAGGVSLVVILIAWAWSGIHPYTFGPPRVVEPPATPLRVVPANPGGLVVPGANIPIMSGEMSDDATPRLAPAGQAPDIAALDQAAGLAASAAPTAGAGMTGGTASPEQTERAVSSATDEPQKVTPAASQVPRPGSTASSAAQAEGMSTVQLAATSTEDGVLAIWVKLQQKFPDLMKDRQPEIIPAIVNGRSVWRLRIGGFVSAGAAKSFCDQLTSKGADCTVAAF
ncbi:SPOR domain-containing protein [Acidocella sp.]|uniref:SPOR domain-containing protein n=1 Tax=Acidocella sp. TaxID=50710 RepID=UPI003D0378FD